MNAVVSLNVEAEEVIELKPVCWSAADPANAAAVLDAVVAMKPALRKRAPEAEKLRRIPPDTIRDLHEAGVFKMNIPVEYGGYALTPSQQHAVYTAIAEGCASTAWVSWVTGGGQSIMALYDRRFQDEVFQMDWAGPLNSGVANEHGPGVARRVEGGYMLSGRWPFCSGGHYSAYHHLGAVCRDGETIVPIICMVPHEEVAILDDWHVMGLKATGSNTATIEEEVFVPDHRVRTATDFFMMASTADANEGILYKIHPLLLAGTTMSGTALGCARAAIELLRQKIRTRGISNSIYPKQDEAPITHIQLGELHCKLITAELVAKANLERVEENARNGVPFSELELAQTTLETAYVNKICSEITEQVLRASGASSIHENSLFQRLFRDSRVPTLHAQSMIENRYEHYGRSSLGISKRDEARPTT